jgi:glycosyltransferase involved in cell wall biosynthesis
MRTIAPYVDHFTTVCRSLAAETARDWGVGGDRVSVIPSGVDISAIDAEAPKRAEARARYGITDPEAIVIGALGWIRPVKRIGDLVEAVGRLSDKRVHLLLLGGVRYVDPEALRLRAVELGFGDRIHFAGQVDNAAAAIHALDVLVNCSVFEGASNAIIEAMAARLPVVATAVGGSPELVVDGETGILVPPSAPDRLAGALSRLLADPEMRRTMGARGRILAERDRSIEAMVGGHTALYRRIAAEPPHRTAERAADGAKGLVRGVEALVARLVAVAVAPRPPSG